MAAPEFVPPSPTERVRLPWESPPVVPPAWTLDRPGEIFTRQPEGPRLGYQGPDQGYALVLANRFRDRLKLAAGEHADDAVTGCVLIGTRRASLYGRAPVVHDLTIAFTMWGYLDSSPPAELLRARRARFQAAAHDYETARAIVDAVPEDVLRMTPADVAAAYPARWRELTGA
jgi:hypothetical protein